MKQIFTSKILRKVMILSFLVVGLMFVGSNDNTRTVEAAPCCSSCGGLDAEETDIACYNLCGGYNSCFYDCRSDAIACLQICVNCGGGGSCGLCYGDSQCLTGNCVGEGSGPNGSGHCTCP